MAVSEISIPWIDVTSDGQFDIPGLEESEGVWWVFPDDLLRALPPEIFMRNYFEPELLPRMLSCNRTEEVNPDACAKEFKPVRPLASLNRVQPLVDIHAEWEKETAGIASPLAEWFGANHIPITLLDVDTEKARGPLKHFFNGTVCSRSEPWRAAPATRSDNCKAKD
jgi:hypothetical protein